MAKYEAYFFPNGNIAVTDAKEQIVELQKESMVSLFLKFVEEKGYNPLEFEIHLPHGIAKPFKTENGWNWGFN